MNRLTVLIVTSFLLTGCMGGLEPLAAGAPTVALDEDGDGVPEALVYADADGRPLTDPATGGPAEVPLSRERFAAAGGVDTAVAGLLETLGMLGVPLAGGVGALWGRARPARRALHAETLFRGLVGAVQHARENGGLSADALAQLDAALSDANAQVAGLNRAIALAKADRKTPQ
ncbi:MAG: hypothetical protein GX591_06705 [Planctomycetes bacterium]|nr:hypothetical protein [Planctomycetota bacterium]